MTLPIKVSYGDLAGFRNRSGIQFVALEAGEKLFLFDDGKLIFEYTLFSEKSILYNFNITKEEKRYSDDVIRFGSNIIDVLEHLTTEYPSITEYFLFHLSSK